VTAAVACDRCDHMATFLPQSGELARALLPWIHAGAVTPSGMGWRRGAGVTVLVSPVMVGACQLIFPLDAPGPNDAGSPNDGTVTDVHRDAADAGKPRDATVPRDSLPPDGSDAGMVDRGVDQGNCASLSDADNCGACGHTCLGGACQDGGCQPILIKAGLYYAGYVRAADGGPFFTTTGNPYPPIGPTFEGSGVWQVQDGGARSIAIEPGIGYVGDLAISNGRVYYTQDFSIIGAYDVANGATTTLVAAGGDSGDTPFLLAADNASVYWCGGSTLFRQAQDSDAAVVVAAANYVSDMAWGGGRLWWTMGQTNQTGQLTYYPTVDGGISLFDGSVAVPDAGTNVAGVVVDDAGAAYWVATGNGGGVTNGAVLYANANGSVTTIASNQARPLSIWIDATHVYWVNNGTSGGSDGMVMRISRHADGGAPEVLAMGQAFPVAISGDDKAIYWLTAGNSTGTAGALWELAK
jgi:hypothetical protein